MRIQLSGLMLFSLISLPLFAANQISNPDVDSDGDGISDRYERILKTNPNDPKSTPKDLDKDGIPDAHDLDIDGDGVNNWQDPFPDNPNEFADADGDGIGDKNDQDSDGDGYSNDAEKQAGTNPHNKREFPDTQGPILEVTALPETVDAREIIVSGMAFDLGMGVERVQIVNADGDVFKAHFNYETHWRVLVRLSQGENLLQVAAYDKANNPSRKVIKVHYRP